MLGLSLGVVAISYWVDLQPGSGPSCPFEGWKGTSERFSSACIPASAFTDILCGCNEALLLWEMSMQSTSLEWAGPSPHFSEPAVIWWQPGAAGNWCCKSLCPGWGQSVREADSHV